MIELVKRAEAHRAAGISKMTAWRLERNDPTFPKAIQVAPNSFAYYVHEWDQWIQARPRREPTDTIEKKRAPKRPRSPEPEPEATPSSPPVAAPRARQPRRSAR